jgi:hypothetical protein
VITRRSQRSFVTWFEVPKPCRLKKISAYNSIRTEYFNFYYIQMKYSVRIELYALMFFNPECLVTSNQVTSDLCDLLMTPVYLILPYHVQKWHFQMYTFDQNWSKSRIIKLHFQISYDHQRSTVITRRSQRSFVTWFEVPKPCRLKKISAYNSVRTEYFNFYSITVKYSVRIELYALIFFKYRL